MRAFIKFCILILVLFFSWNFISERLSEENYVEWKEKITTIMDEPSITSALETLQNGVDTVIDDIQTAIANFQKEQTYPEQVEKAELQPPESQSFSIHNIEIGTAKEIVDEMAGSAQRALINEYGVDWFVYHENYHNFFLVAYNEENRVTGLYTNQDLISSKHGIALGSPMESVRAALGQPITGIRKGLVTYRTNHHGEYDVFQLDNSYITVFYDKHNNNTVTALQIISNELEQKRENYYPPASTALKEGFELLLFDLTNAERVKHGLPTLTWDEQVRETARAHSSDMAINQYFDHINLEGQSPFDRMAEDNIRFRLAGENLASGQPSSIFAHEGLMNSLGHRENILHPGFASLGIGAAFDHEGRPYFTEKFITR